MRTVLSIPMATKAKRFIPSDSEVFAFMTRVPLLAERGAQHSVHAVTRLLVTSCASLFAAPVHAQEGPQHPWAGVWQGTIGSLPVHVCLSSPDGKLRTGSYYYDASLVSLRLQPNGETGTLSESKTVGGDESARWQLAMAGTARLSGQWRQLARTLPVSLSRVPFTANDDGPCASDAFLAPRIQSVGVAASSVTAKGIRYDRLVYNVGKAFATVAMESFAITEVLPGDRAINAALRLNPATPDGDGDFLSCMRQSLSMAGVDGDYAVNVRPAMIAPEFVSASVSVDWYCGGAHPDGSTRHRTFDRRNGKEIDLAGWLLPSAVPARARVGERGPTAITPALRRLILARFRPKDRECREPVSTAPRRAKLRALGGRRLRPVARVRPRPSARREGCATSRPRGERPRSHRARLLRCAALDATRRWCR